jgi:hypothetical protein
MLTGAAGSRSSGSGTQHLAVLDGLIARADPQVEPNSFAHSTYCSSEQEAELEAVFYLKSGAPPHGNNLAAADGVRSAQSWSWRW